MKFIKFPEATSEIIVPGGPIPFVICEGANSVVCVEFTDDEIREIKKNNNRLYLLGGVIPGLNQPAISIPYTKSPFIPNMQVNGKSNNGTPSKG